MRRYTNFLIPFLFMVIFYACSTVPSYPKPTITDDAIQVLTNTASEAFETLQDAIGAVKERYPMVAEIDALEDTSDPVIGVSENIFVIDRPAGWNLVFWEGSGDCPSGCLNDHYWYFSVEASGEIEFTGEYRRDFDARTGGYVESGVPMWEIP